MDFGLVGLQMEGTHAQGVICCLLELVQLGRGYLSLASKAPKMSKSDKIEKIKSIISIQDGCLICLRTAALNLNSFGITWKAC